MGHRSDVGTAQRPSPTQNMSTDKHNLNVLTADNKQNLRLNPCQGRLLGQLCILYISKSYLALLISWVF